MPTIEWQIARVEKIKQETPKVKSFTLTLPNFLKHRAGQHYDVRLTATDGYRAQRSYSIASAPEKSGQVELTVDRLEDGEVSAYLHDVLERGDQLEMRGPIGGYFVWEAEQGGPLLLVGGGSGVVPLMSMLRHRVAAGSQVETRFLASSRNFEDIIYQQELDELDKKGDGLKIFHTLTRSQPAGWKEFAKRIDAQILNEVAGPLGNAVKVFICGPTTFVEVVADQLAETRVPASQIKTERFGPSGN